jgi:hypothetical protein
MRSEKNRLVLEMLRNDLSLAKVAKISGLSYRDIYRWVLFYYDQVRSLVARREDMSRVSYAEVESRFATDSQALTINWTTKRRRIPVVFQHLCTAHARSGFVVEASFQLDPAVSPAEAEAISAAAQEDQLSTTFRRHARIWTEADFQDYLDQRAQNAGLPYAEVHGLPATGPMIRHDIMQIAQALRLRDHLANAPSAMFVMDGDARLKMAYRAAFQPEIADMGVHLLVVTFEKGMTNDKRNQVVAPGRADLSAATGLSQGQFRDLSNEDFANLVDTELAMRLISHPVGDWNDYPFSAKSEPERRIRLITDDHGRPTRARETAPAAALDAEIGQ